jgi:microcystin degradation protein MlrC
MTYLFSALKTYLEANGYSDIQFNYAYENTDTDQTKSRILFVASSNSEQGNRVPTQRFRFTLYVRDNNRQVATERSHAIYNLLKNYSVKSGGAEPILIHDIQGNPPYFWGIYPKSVNASEFAMDMEALISNDDANL